MDMYLCSDFKSLYKGDIVKNNELVSVDRSLLEKQVNVITNPLSVLCTCDSLTVYSDQAAKRSKPLFGSCPGSRGLLPWERAEKRLGVQATILA